MRHQEPKSSSTDRPVLLRSTLPKKPDTGPSSAARGLYPLRTHTATPAKPCLYVEKDQKLS
jgi:hypothetical protein